MSGPAPGTGAPADGAERSPSPPPPAPVAHAATGLTPQQKAAVILGVLGREAAGPLLARLDEASLRAFTRAMASIRRIGASEVRAVIAEFLGALEDSGTAVRGGLAAARSLLENHVAEGILARLVEEAEPPSPESTWRRLARIDDERLAAFLAREHPQTVAVVASRLPAERAAGLLDTLPAELAREVVLGLARLESLDPALLEAISEAICRDLLTTDTHGRADGPAARVGAIMDYLGATMRKAILDDIERTDPDFARAVRRAMFTVEDIPKRLAPRAAAAIVRSIDQQTLLHALVSIRDSAPEVEEFLLANISSRMADQLREEMKEVGSVSRRAGERAQAALVRTVRELIAAGEIELAEEPDDETAAT